MSKGLGYSWYVEYPSRIAEQMTYHGVLAIDFVFHVDCNACGRIMTDGRGYN